MARPPAPSAAADESGQPWARRAARGAGVSGLNPKALLLFVAVLPQFVDRHSGVPVAAQIAVLGAIHTANCAVAYLGPGTLALPSVLIRQLEKHFVDECLCSKPKLIERMIRAISFDP